MAVARERARVFESAINPLGDAADITAGRDLFRQKCEVCHAYDGSGKTEIGTAEYPRPATASATVADLRRRDLLSHPQRHPKHRHAGVEYARTADLATGRLHPPSAGSRAADRRRARCVEAAATTPPTMSGSAACQKCHQDIYERWSKTRMANVVRDPREHPGRHHSRTCRNPIRWSRFTKDDIAFVYGSKWKQRYFKKVGDDYFPLPAQWDVTHKIWRAYMSCRTADWWTPYYPADNMQRPTGPLCDGCHSVNYDVATKTVTEWNVGCEKCHGPGSDHVKQPSRRTIVNPARLDYVHANDTCIQCHSQGRPLTNPIDGKYYDWPVGFHVG